MRKDLATIAFGFLLILALQILYIYVQAGLIDEQNQLVTIEAEIKDLTLKNDILRAEILNKEALINILPQAQKAGFVHAKDVYLQ